MKIAIPNNLRLDPRFKPIFIGILAPCILGLLYLTIYSIVSSVFYNNDSHILLTLGIILVTTLPSSALIAYFIYYQDFMYRKGSMWSIYRGSEVILNGNIQDHEDSRKIILYMNKCGKAAMWFNIFDFEKFDRRTRLRPNVIGARFIFKYEEDAVMFKLRFG